MATKLQTYTTASDAGNNRLTNENGEFYQRTMLEALYNSVVFMPYGKKSPIPKNAGATTSWRRLEMPTLASTALTEGVTPDGLDLTVNKVSATVQQYGAWTKITDLLDMTGLDPIITETASLFGDHAGLSMDIVIRDILAASTNKQFANARASRATLQAGDVLTTAEIQKARATMKKNNVKPIKLPNGNMGYLAFVHPDSATTIFNLQEWKDQNTYVDAKNREAGIIGQMYGIYFLETNIATTFTDGGAGGNLAGKAMIVIGADAFGVPDIAGSSKPEIMVYTEGDTSNPINQYSTVGWKSTFATCRLNDSIILVMEYLNA